ncbi:MAG: lipopolysaccharide biosynthesis protein [Pseudomonadota bacterium]
MTLAQQVARGAVWMTVARIGGQVFGLASTIVVARFITPDDYGVFAAAMGLMTMVSIFAELPVSQAIIHLRDVDDEDYDTAFTIGVLRGVVLAILMVALAIPLAAFMKDDRIAPVMAWLGVYVLLLGLRNARMDIYIRNMDFSRDAWLELGSKFISFLFAAVFAVVLKSYWAMVISLCAAAAVQVILSHWFKPKMPRLTLKSFKRIFSYSIWVGGGTILGQVYRFIDTLTLGRLAGTTTLGVFSIGQLLSTRIGQAVTGPATRPLFAAFAQIQTEPARTRNVFLQSVSLMAFLIVPITVTLILLADPIVMILLGPKWANAVIVVQVISGGLLSQILLVPLQTMLMGLGHPRTLFFRGLALTALYLPLAIWAVTYHDLIGLLVVKLLLITTWLFIDALIIKRTLDLPLLEQAKSVHRSFIAGTAMVTVYFLCRGWIPKGHEFFAVSIPLAFVGILGGIAYVSAYVALWLAAGRPDGIERKGVMLIEKMRPSNRRSNSEQISS